MRIRCSQSQLINGINTVQKAVPSKSSMTILECILFNADENGIKLTANDMELGYVKEKVISLLPKFEFYMQGGLIGTMNKKFTFLKPKYLLDFNGWTIEGDVWGLKYQILNGTEPIAMVSKKFISVADEYTIDVFNDQNYVLALLIVLAVDIDKARSDNDAAASININS